MFLRCRNRSGLPGFTVTEKPCSLLLQCCCRRGFGTAKANSSSQKRYVRHECTPSHDLYWKAPNPRGIKTFSPELLYSSSSRVVQSRGLETPSFAGGGLDTGPGGAESCLQAPARVRVLDPAELPAAQCGTHRRRKRQRRGKHCSQPPREWIDRWAKQ